MGEKKGIDVSHHQGDIDFGKVKKAGIDFVMIRAGYGWENPDTQTDRKFRKNYSAATRAGLPCGAYHYSYAKTPGQAELEANFFLKIVSGCRFAYPVAFDLEDVSQAGLSRKNLTDIANAFCEKLERAGYYVCLYTNPDWLKNQLDRERLSRYDLWLAHYAAAPGVQNIGMWQYSSTGVVDGISGKVDLDLAFRDYPSIMAAKGRNGFQTKVVPKQYKVKPGDTLSGIAKKHGLSLGSLIQSNPQITNPNLIHSGDLLRLE